MIIVLAGQKGGAGKSTIAISLVAEAMARGMSALLVDADTVQGSSRTWGATATEVGHPTPTIVTMGATMHKPGQLLRVRAGFDLVVVDCPPHDGDVQRSALMVADVAILPCGQSALEAWALASSIELVASAQTVRPDLRAAVLLTRVQEQTTLGKGAREVVSETGFPVLETTLGYRVAYQESVAAGLGVTTYAPRDVSADEVRALFVEIQAFAKRKPSHARKAAS